MVKFSQISPQSIIIKRKENSKKYLKNTGRGRVFRPETRVPGRFASLTLPGRDPRFGIFPPGNGPVSGFHFKIFQVLRPGTWPVPIYDSKLPSYDIKFENPSRGFSRRYLGRLGSLFSLRGPFSALPICNNWT